MMTYYPDIVNVAFTRAKYRLYIVGDRNAWSKNENLKLAGELIGTEQYYE